MSALLKLGILVDLDKSRGRQLHILGPWWRIVCSTVVWFSGISRILSMNLFISREKGVGKKCLSYEYMKLAIRKVLILKMSRNVNLRNRGAVCAR